jgi:TetR/AcrR family transcriptional regulator
MSSKEKILFAAIKVFALKGRHGARMEEIAAEAGLNKAMVYYIFQNRDVLYREVLKFIMEWMHSKKIEQFEADTKRNLPADVLLKNIIERDFDLFVSNQDYVRITLEAMAGGGDALRSILLEMKDEQLELKKKIIEAVIVKGQKEGLFGDIDSEELFGNIMGMTIIYFLTKPIGDIFCIDTESPDYLEKKKKNIIDLVLYGVLSRK